MNKIKTKISDKKIKTVENIKTKINDSESIIFADYRGLKVSESTELRKIFKKSKIYYKVLKNNLIKIACDDCGFSDLKKFLKGPTAIVFGKDDVTSVKLIFNFSKDHECLKIKGGFLNNKIVEIEELKKISELPSKEVLLNQIVITLNSPIQNTLYVLSVLIKNLIFVVNLIKIKKEKEEKQII